MPLKKVFLKFVKKPDGSYEPSVSKQKTSIGAFLIPSGYFDNTGINANGTDIDGIRTILADFFTKSPYTVQGTPLFFFEGTNNLITNVANVLGRAMGVKAGLGSLCLLAHLSFSSIKTDQTIGRFQIDGATAYCTLKNTALPIDTSFFASLMNQSTRLLSYDPPASVDMASATTKQLQINVGIMPFIFNYTPQGIVKTILNPLSPVNPYSIFINSQTLQNKNDTTLISARLFTAGLAHFFSDRIGTPIVTNSYIENLYLTFLFPNFTTVSDSTKTYSVSYGTKADITSHRLFASFGYNTITSFDQAKIVSLDNKLLGTYAFAMTMGGTSYASSAGYISRYIIFPRIKALENAYAEVSSVCNIYTSRYSYYVGADSSPLVPYKIKAQCGFIIKFPQTINGSCLGNSTDFFSFESPRTISAYAAGQVIYFTDPTNNNAYFYDEYNVAVGVRFYNGNGVKLQFIVTYSDQTTETRSVTLYISELTVHEAYFNVISNGTHLSSVLKTTLNCTEINEAYSQQLKNIPDFATEGVLLTPNSANKKITKLSVYVEYGADFCRLNNLLLILSPKT